MGWGGRGGYEVVLFPLSSCEKRSGGVGGGWGGVDKEERGCEMFSFKY